MTDIIKLVDDLNKRFGGNKIIIKKASELPPLRTFPFNIPALDLDLGGGALWGRTTILAGEKGCGKTSTAYALAGHANQIGIPVYWFDLEKAFDKDRGAIFGMNMDLTFVIRGELSAENNFGLLRDTIREVKKQDDSRAIFIVDSIAGMVVENLMENAASSQFGGSARVINQSVAVWQIMLGDNQILLLINQLRTKMTMMGDPNMMPGGMGQEFWASATVWVKPGETLKDGTDPVGQQMKWTIKKSRGSNPKEIGVVDYLYQTGFQTESNLIMVALELGLLEQSGAWFTFNGERFHGKEKLIERIMEDKPFLTELHKQVYEKMPIPNWNGLEPNW